MDAFTLRYSAHACLPNEFRVLRNADGSLEIHGLVKLTDGARAIAISINVTRSDRPRDGAHLTRIDGDAWLLMCAVYHPDLPPLSLHLARVPEGTFV